MPARSRTCCQTLSRPLRPAVGLRTCSSAQLDTAALRAHCREHLAGYKVPRRFVAIEDTPRSMLGKILRKQVRERILPSL